LFPVKVLGVEKPVTPLPEWYFDKDVKLEGKKINNDVMVAGGTVLIDKDSIINGYLMSAGGEVIIEGEVNKNVIVAGGKVKIGDNAKLKGYVIAVGGEVEVAPGAKIEGEKYIKQGDMNKAKEVKNKAKSFDLVGFFGKTLSLMFFVYLFKCCSEKVWKRGREKFWSVLLRGLGVVMLVPIIGILTMVTLVGFPIGFIGLILYGISLYVAQLIAAWGLGKWMVENKIFNIKNEYGLAMLGLIVLSALSWIPGVNILVGMMATFWGMGLIWAKSNYK
jgi:cytoskeletal protein CcmA (bactofilin family)